MHVKRVLMKLSTKDSLTMAHTVFIVSARKKHFCAYQRESRDGSYDVAVTDWLCIWKKIKFEKMNDFWKFFKMEIDLNEKIYRAHHLGNQIRVRS